MKWLTITLFIFFLTIFAQQIQVADTIGDTTSQRAEDTTAVEQEITAPTNISELNSNHSDFTPFIMPDGRTIYFSSSRAGGKGGEDIYFSTIQHGYWSKPQNLYEPINTKYNEGAICLSPDGDEIYITICGRPDSYGGCDLYISKKQGEFWNEPRNLGKKVNSTWWDGHPCLSPTGDTLYFASDRFGGFGGLDIYYTYKVNGEWVKPKNFGYPINNARDQTSPFLHIDGRTLYFSSAGHGGLGGLDVLFTRLDTVTGKWLKPQNIGPPVNTSGNDYFFSIPAAGDYIYFASDRPAGYGGFDIYSYPLEDWQRPQVVATLVGKVVDAESSEPLFASVSIERLSDGKVIQKLETDSLSGQFFAVLRAGETYGISVSAPGYAFASENYEIKLQEGYTELRHIFRLRKIEVGSIVSLVNIFFDFAKYELRDESKPELERIYDLMQKYPEMKIEVQGFADSIGSSEFNLFLSRMRAKAVYDWLIDKSIDSSRITYVGYGEEEQGVTEEDLQMSRRVQFEIIELGKLPMPEPQNPILDTIPKNQKDSESENNIRGELKIDLSDTTLTISEYKQILGSVGLDKLADSIFTMYIINEKEYRFGELDERPVAVKTAALGYPQKARNLGIEGIVLVEFTIDTIGNVVPGSAEIVQAIPLGIFEGVAIESIYHWKYSPAVEKNKKVETKWLQALIFRKD
ncbi:hypothetical protein DRQ33_02900 [bacterium]|nr:MAG: hypothetical protein DRQ33_02900 [bacterium]